MNQVYGGSDDGYASHSFIELYNPMEQDVFLEGWSVQYRSSEDGAQADAWAKYDLHGTIRAKDYYLIRCAAMTDDSNVAYQVPSGDGQWKMSLHNKGISVALMSNQTLLETNDVMSAAGFVDLAAANGNDGEPEQYAPAVETAADIQSKKKAIRRVGFVDTDDNSADFVAINYSNPVSDDLGPHGAAPEFTDVAEDAWYALAVQYTVEKGWFRGITETAFGPDVTMTRAMFVTVLGRHEGIADASADTPSTTDFTDVVLTHYYASHVNWAQENEVVEGYSDTIYSPFDDVTREQMVTMMYRYAAVTGKDITVNGLDGLNRFKDGDKVADWAQEAMAWAVEQGII